MAEFFIFLLQTCSCVYAHSWQINTRTQTRAHTHTLTVSTQRKQSFAYTQEINETKIQLCRMCKCWRSKAIYAQNSLSVRTLQEHQRRCLHMHTSDAVVHFWALLNVLVHACVGEFVRACILFVIVFVIAMQHSTGQKMFDVLFLCSFSLPFCSFLGLFNFCFHSATKKLHTID